ncbi:hypothetical protein B566_EDAN014612 [Ephemera danica]|nr:hypothetical protein B566_EDAN014612 [Ephemera danica]
MASSGYFRAAFQFGPDGGKRGAARSRVTVPNIPGDILEIIIRFMYLDEIELDGSNMWAILRAADFLQIERLTDRCIDYLEKNMCVTTCCDLLNLTDKTYFLPRVFTVVQEYALAKFCDPQQSADERRKAATKLEPDILEKLLRNDQLNAPNEQLVWLAILWNVQEKGGKIENLLGALRLGLLSREFVSGNREVIEWLTRNPETSTETPEVAPQDLVPRYPQELVLTIGGWSANGPSNNVYAYDIEADHWSQNYTCQQVEELEKVFGDKPLAYHGLVQVDNYLYVIGGIEHYDRGNHDSSLCYRLDLTDFTLETINPLSVPRNFVNCLALDGLIYAIGGRESMHRRHRSGEVYDTATGQWTDLPSSMRHMRSDAGVAVLNRKIYIIGGYTGAQVLSNGECYDVDTGEWETIPSMNFPRSGVRCVALKDHIFAFGGFSGDARLNSVERYDPESREWLMLSPMSVTRSNMSAVVIRDYILVMGGYSGNIGCTDLKLRILGEDRNVPEVVAATLRSERLPLATVGAPLARGFLPPVPTIELPQENLDEGLPMAQELQVLEAVQGWFFVQNEGGEDSDGEVDQWAEVNEDWIFDGNDNDEPDLD